MDREQAVQVLNLVHRMGKRINNKKAFGEIPRAEFFMMAVIDEYQKKHEGDGCQGITVSRLAKIMEVTTPAASKLLRVMEEKGYIYRLTDDDDRRVVYIGLTPKGSEIIIDAYEKAVDHTMLFLQILGKEDTGDLIRIFQRILTIIPEELDDGKMIGCEGGLSEE